MPSCCSPIIGAGGTGDPVCYPTRRRRARMQPFVLPWREVLVERSLIRKTIAVGLVVAAWLAAAPTLPAQNAPAAPAPPAEPLSALAPANLSRPRPAAPFN